MVDYMNKIFENTYSDVLNIVGQIYVRGIQWLRDI